MFDRLFGKKGDKPKKQPPSNIEQTNAMLTKKIQDMELRIQNLDVKQKYLQNEAKEKLKAGDKAGAKRLLAKKKKLVEQIKQCEGAMAMMEEQQMIMENTGMMKGTMEAIKNANMVIKEAQKDLNVEDMENIKDDMVELKQAQAEMGDFFAEYTNADNDEVEDELAALEEEMAKQDTGALPMANNEKINKQKNNLNRDEDALNQFMFG